MTSPLLTLLLPASILILIVFPISEALRSPPGSGDLSSRRQWLTKQTFIGGAILTAAIANKVAIRGPPPFRPVEKSLENKVIVITGGNTGIGFESAKRLAKAGATIVITSRCLDKGKKAVAEIQRACEEANVKTIKVHALPLDLCNLKSVKEFAIKFKEEMGAGTKIDVLLNNAGTMALPTLELTQDNFEKTFQTNHLGHFALTALLFPVLSKNGARVINVSSGAHWSAFSGLDLENLNGEKSYGPWASYGASKLENILFTKELQRRVDASSREYKNFKSFSLTPGSVRTELLKSFWARGEENFSMMDTGAGDLPTVGSYFSPKSLALLPYLYFTKSVERGATTQIWLASGEGDDILRGGEYLANCKVDRLAPAATDMGKAKQLWQISEEMCGIPFKI